MKTLLKGCRAIDPLQNLDKELDILISENGTIEELAPSLEDESACVIDRSGCIVGLGLVDMHVHFRDPGYEYKEDIETGARAAVHGGYTDVATMPNTYPITDTGTEVTSQIRHAESVGLARVHPVGALTKGEEGQELAEIGDMVFAGAVGFSDDGRGVQSAGMMRSCMEYVSQFDRAVIAHCEDESLSAEGVVNEGRASLRLGMFGWPAAAEEVEVLRNIELCRLTGCPLHIAHISTERSLNLVRAAKKEGLPVTCEVTPHHLFLCDEDISEKTYNTNLKVNPPLRTAQDTEALQKGIIDGSIDAIVSDHAPHAAHEKECEFEIALFGTIGLETTLSLVITHLVNTQKITWTRLFELCAIHPRAILRLPSISLKPGEKADLTIIDPKKTITIDESYFMSKATNSAFLGHTLKGVARDVFIDGKAVLENYEITQTR